MVVVVKGSRVAGFVTIAILGLAGWWWSRGIPVDPSEDAAEYSALAELPVAETVPIVVDPTTAVVSDGASEKSLDPKRMHEAFDEVVDPMRALPAERSGGAVPVGHLRGERFKIYGRPANEFNNEILTRLGFEDDEVASIREKFSGYINELRDFDPEARITASIRLTQEERDQNRRLRKRYLDDREYDAALLATRQANRAYFSGPIPVGRAAAKVGIQAGDELIELNGVRIFDSLDYTDGRDSVSEGELYRLVISRRGELFDVSLRCCSPGWGRVQLRLGRPLGEPIDH